MNKLLIHADPGARSGFVAAWLQDNLAHAGFDAGATTKTPFLKIHNLDNNERIKSFPGTKIRIKSTFTLLSLQLLLFLRKNIHVQLPNFTKDEYSLETFSKVYIFAKECFDNEKLVDYSLYDYSIAFNDTFDMDKMINLYYQVNNRYPDKTNINQAVIHNKVNQIELDNAHACSIAAMILETESNMNLKETNRTWSIPILYNTTAIEDLYTIVKSLIIPTNYQIPSQID
jgi:hypothetical protein